MTEAIKKLKNTDVPAAVYYKSSGGFCAGFVRETDDEFALMEFISPGGHFDGYHCIRIEEILKMDVGTRYLNNLARVYRHFGEPLPALKVSHKGVLESFTDAVVRNKWLCTMEVGFETLEKISGYVTGREWNIVRIQLVDENGRPDGYTQLDLEEIVYIGVQSELEKYLEVLAALGGEPDGGGESDKRGGKKSADRHILSFPFGK